jgi:uncharacterized protein (TIGR03435 family)
MSRFIGTLVLAIAGIAASASAQSISYVASVKPNNAADPSGLTEYQPGGRFTAIAATVRTLLRLAYRIQDYQLVGAPAWFSSKRFDIAAKVEDNPPPSLQILLQTLLKDRFGLAIHNETRELPTFALVQARSDGKPGPQLVKSAFDCAAYLAAPHPPPEPGRTPNCATRINSGSLSGKSISMTQLATSLAPFVSRFTVDKTGLTGGFDVELTWSSDDSAEPGIFTAIQEQLGLKLVSEKGPVNVMVVDRAEEPSGN